MNNQTIPYVFFGIFLGLWIIIFLLDKKYCMLREGGVGHSKPFSWSRVQMTWWTVIILTAFVTAIFRASGVIPVFDNSTLFMLGISSGTTVSAAIIDISDRSNPTITDMGQDMKSAGIIMDVLSDKNGINIHRFQTFIFNVIFGAWFMYQSYLHLSIPPDCKVCANPSDIRACTDCITAYANSVMPVIAPNNLVLMAVSSGIYAALKTTENKQPSGSATSQQIDDNIRDSNSNSNNSSNVIPTQPVSPATILG